MKQLVGFSQETKAELIQMAQDPQPCCRKAELAGLLRGAGSLEWAGGRLRLAFTADNPAVARHAFRLLKEVFAGPVELSVAHQRRLGRSRIYRVQAWEPGGAGEAGLSRPWRARLLELGLTAPEFLPLEHIRPAVLHKHCCKVAFLRGAFLARGSVAEPQRAYHLEFTALSRGHAEDIQRTLQALRIPAKLASRARHWVVYLKSGERIGELLALLGARNTLLGWEELRLRREVRSDINRTMNCDTANVDKSVAAAMEQVQAIQALAAYPGLQALPDRARQVAEARLAHPEASLQELARVLDPPATKSTVYHHLRRLQDLAARRETLRLPEPEWQAGCPGQHPTG